MSKTSIWKVFCFFCFYASDTIDVYDPLSKTDEWINQQANEHRVCVCGGGGGGGISD